MAPENGLNGWLRYAAVPAGLRASAPKHSGITVLLPQEDKTSPVCVAGKELQDGLSGTLHQKVDISFGGPVAASAPGTIYVGTVDAYSSTGGDIQSVPELKPDGFWLSINHDGQILILGSNARGALYGAFD